jgi:peptide/nickel transport system substrate-binding protein
VTNRFDGTISRIDPNGGKVVDIPVGPDPTGIAVGFGSVWVGLAGSNTVVRVDPDTNSVTQSVGVGNGPGSLAVSAHAVWTVNSLDDTVSEINPDTGSVVDTIGVGDGPSGIQVVQGTVWVANEWDGTLSRFEPGLTPARAVVIGSVPQGLTSVTGDLWVSVRGTSTSHRGGTLRMVSSTGFNTLDTRVANDVVSARVLHLIGDGLVAFEPIGGANATLVPDLATSIPTPTDDGTTYSFEIRSGVSYSNGEVLAPSDFRRALEQGFSYSRGAHKYYFGGLVGAEACGDEPGTCDLSEGIVTDDATGTITFHLAAPDPEFLYKLTSPLAYPVPPSVADEEQATTGIPGTGPYMLKAPMTPGGLALVRNPQFQVWSTAAQPDGYVDRIEWTIGDEPEAQVEAVATGEADLMFDVVASGLLEDVRVQFAAQVHSTPISRTYFDVLDNEMPPFNDVRVRQAINLAVDRERVAQIFSGVPTCQQIPPNFPGYQPYCPYTTDPEPDGEGLWTAPDFERAQRLVRRSGTAGMPVTFKYAAAIYGPEWVSVGDYMVELLDELGYRVSVWSSRVGGSPDPGNGPQVELGGWGADYPAASNVITPIFSCDAPFFVSGFCDEEIDAMIDHALEVQSNDPAAAGTLWVEIDRAIVDQAPFLWLANPIDVDFVSERVGNYQSNLQYAVLLNQLWVR